MIRTKHRRCIYTLLASILLFEYLEQITVGGDAISRKNIIYYEFSHLNSAHSNIHHDFFSMKIRLNGNVICRNGRYLRHKKNEKKKEEKKSKNEIMFRVHCFLTKMFHQNGSKLFWNSENRFSLCLSRLVRARCTLRCRE